MLAEHLKIEARIAAGNPPSVAEKAQKTHEAFVKFREWLDRRDRAGGGSKDTETATGGTPNGLPAFREWVIERGAHANGDYLDESRIYVPRT
ncbi:MAG TPA: hypothetical protein VJ783_30430 [Pirellulales bacterium]|nr:hypothetical protein [Pirellulales bacterium]